MVEWGEQVFFLHMGQAYLYLWTVHDVASHQSDVIADGRGGCSRENIPVNIHTNSLTRTVELGRGPPCTNTPHVRRQMTARKKKELPTLATTGGEGVFMR